MYSHVKHQQTFFDNEGYEKGSKAPKKDELHSLEVSENRRSHKLAVGFRWDSGQTMGSNT